MHWQFNFSLFVLCSPINAPVSSSFAGALRYINVSSNTSGSLVERLLNNDNFTLSYDGVSFSGLLPVVRDNSNVRDYTEQKQFSTVDITIQAQKELKNKTTLLHKLTFGKENRITSIGVDFCDWMSVKNAKLPLVKCGVFSFHFAL